MQEPAIRLRRLLHVALDVARSLALMVILHGVEKIGAEGSARLIHHLPRASVFEMKLG